MKNNLNAFEHFQLFKSVAAFQTIMFLDILLFYTFCDIKMLHQTMKIHYHLSPHSSMYVCVYGKGDGFMSVYINSLQFLWTLDL